MKTCKNGTNCIHPEGATLPKTTEYFYQRKNGKWDNLCKLCRIAQSKAYYKTHKAQISARHKTYYEANKPRILAHIYAYRAAHPEAYREARRKHREANREAINRKKREYYWLNRERILIYFKARYQAHRERLLEECRKYYARHTHQASQQRKRYYLANKEQIRAYQAEWRQSNRLKDRATKRRYKARRKGATGTHTAADIELILKGQNGRCWYCGQKLSRKYHVDHFIPLILGGTNNPGNLRLACPHCNISKGGKSPHEWSGRLL